MERGELRGSGAPPTPEEFEEARQRELARLDLRIGSMTGQTWTKFAVNAISEALRQELIEDKIRVTMVEPGAGETELATHITDEEAQQGVQALHELDILQAEDIASAVAYCVTRPERVSVNEILIRPTEQAY
jgi:NADP-dependent 3-hydroxy acid dehydrogenase YdfG